MGILGIALDLAAIGRSIVPAYIDKYGDKRPIVKWKNGEKNYQQEAATVEEIQAWDTLHRPKLWGMVTGAVSGIITLDFDGEDGRKLVDELGLHPHRRTGSGGYQQDFKHPGFKVKTVNSKTSKEKPWAKRYPGLDIRGDGGLAMIAGNNANGPYVWLRDEANLYEPDDLSILPPDMLDILGLVPKKSKTPHIDTLLREALLMCEQDGRNNAGFVLARGLRDCGITRDQAEDIMRKYQVAVPEVDGHGEDAPYTEEEAMNTVASVYESRKQHIIAGSPGLDGLIDIDVNGQVREVGQAALEQLERHAKNLYIWDGKLARVGHMQDGTPSITALSENELLVELTHSANFIANTEKGTVNKAPPKNVISYIKGVPLEKLHFPTFNGFVRTPTLKPDGTILQKPGHDGSTGLYYMPNADMERCVIPNTPTVEQVKSAVALLEDYFGEFPWKAQADRANAYGLLLSPFIRSFIHMHIPLAVVDAPSAGTGKGELVTGFNLVWTGEEMTALALSESEPENRKAITTALSGAPIVIVMDNLDIDIKSAHLARALTSTWWGDRYLSTNKSARLRNNAIWIATGNQVTVRSDDMKRRFYRIRIDSGMNRPDERDNFRHDLSKDIPVNRPELVAACLTLIRYWYTQGHKLDTTIPAKATFTEWARAIGGILKSAGIDGFLSNADEVRNEVDPDSGEWLGFYEEWIRVLDDKEYMSNELFKLMKSSDPARVAVLSADCLPEDVRMLLDKGQLTPKKLGVHLAKQVDKPYGEHKLTLKRRIDSHTQARYWRVEIGATCGTAVCAVCGSMSKSKDTSDEKRGVENEKTISSVDHTPPNFSGRSLGFDILQHTSTYSNPSKEGMQTEDNESFMALLEAGTNKVHTNGRTPSQNGHKSIPQLSEAMKLVIGDESFMGNGHKEG